MSNATPARNAPVSKAREALSDFERRQRVNFFHAERQLGRLLETQLGERFARHRDHFERFGEIAAGPLDEAAAINNRSENLPRLERWSPFGDRIEAIANHPSYDACGRHIYEDGEVIAAYAEPASNVRALGLFLLSSHVGEAGHNCPVACTAGIVKSLESRGSDALKERYLPGLLTARYEDRLDGAQFLTEVQGGSDVGMNAVRAEQIGEDLGTTTWAITGEKWFCSNAEADLILMTARVGERSGTGGLGLFLVPRLRPDGTLNNYELRRLKDKLGTRSMPSAEIDFRGAFAWAVGPIEEGFKTVMTHVIQTSRLYNTMAVAGNARRAYLVARAYARTRRAFGQTIDQYPLVHGMLAELRGLYSGMVAAGFHLARMLDNRDTRKWSKDESDFFRVATNLVKMRSSQHAHRAVMIAIETLGGNGAIESFSVLPRLLRDNVVCENWEGTHNTLISQTHRDFAVVGLAKGFFSELERLLEVAEQSTADALVHARSAITAAREALPAIVHEPDPGRAAFFLRPHAERLGDAFFAIAWGADLAHERDASQRDAETLALAHFCELHLAERRPSHDALRADAIARIAALDT
jgi:acyl-CoA dehydrogenase